MVEEIIFEPIAEIGSTIIQEWFHKKSLKKIMLWILILIIALGLGYYFFIYH